MPSLHSKPFVFTNDLSEKVSSDIGYGSSLMLSTLKNRLVELTQRVRKNNDEKEFIIADLLKKMQSNDPVSVLQAVSKVHSIAQRGDTLDYKEIFGALIAVSRSDNTAAVPIALQAMSLISERMKGTRSDTTQSLRKGEPTISDVLKGIKSKDEQTVARAVNHLACVAQRSKVMDSEEVVEALVRVISRTTASATIKAALCALSCIIGRMSRSESKGRDQFGNRFLETKEGLEMIVGMLGREDEEIITNSLSTIHTLLENYEKARIMAREMGTTPALIRLLDDEHSPETLTLASDALYYLIEGDEEEMGKLKECDGVARLEALQKTHKNHPQVGTAVAFCQHALANGKMKSEMPDSTPGEKETTLKNRLAELTAKVRKSRNERSRMIVELLEQLKSTDQETVLTAVKHIHSVALRRDTLDCKEVFVALMGVSRSNSEAAPIALRAMSLIAERMNGESSENGLPSTVGLLAGMHSSDQETVSRTVKQVASIAKQGDTLDCEEIVDALLVVIRTADHETMLIALGAFSCIAERLSGENDGSPNPNMNGVIGEHFLFRKEGLEMIVTMLGGQDEKVVDNSLFILHKVLQNYESARPTAREMGATPALALLLDEKRPSSMLTLTAETLHLLIEDDDEERRKLEECDGSARLERLKLAHQDNAQLVTSVDRCLQSLAKNRQAEVPDESTKVEN